MSPPLKINASSRSDQGLSHAMARAMPPARRSPPA